MSLIINGTTIPSSGVINFNGTKLTKVVFNETTVWSGEITQTGSEYYVWSGTSDGSAYITFPTPFSATPKVSFTTKYDNGPHHKNLRVMSKSKTNFRLYAEHAGERGTYSRFRVNWTATGPA